MCTLCLQLNLLTVQHNIIALKITLYPHFVGLTNLVRRMCTFMSICCSCDTVFLFLNYYIYTYSTALFTLFRATFTVTHSNLLINLDLKAVYKTSHIDGSL